MSNIDKQALREAAEKATKGQWQFHDRQSLSHSGSGFVAIAGKEAILCFNAPVGGINQSNNVVKYIAAANPATVLALLDELEAKDKQIEDLKEAFRIALSAAGIDAPAAAGKGE
ncbi:ead/Ea22-like family protein [Enterobacter hormaechei]|uniref:ead/Ea22-like family protein n=1 Tax=Enterobacter hormaechei TaxID=158836 RepID=UPI001C989F82|nr:ead/Ea22-like family protein [Enterobacter hormaechei]MBY5146999.1 ead/Ea22-like family protein [Enterobacter hormaechei]